MEPAAVRIAENGDVWLRVQAPDGRWYEFNQTKVDAYLSGPYTIKIGDIA